MTSSSSFGERTVHPGPIDTSLLRLQEYHVSGYVWNGEPDRCLFVRRAQDKRQRGVHVPHQIIPHLRQAGFYGVAQITFFQIEHSLISALVERWRPETHTFHMSPGECTITLQDVAVQLGLSIDGRPVTGVTLSEWRPLVERLLGIAPPEEQLQGGRLRMGWLNENFGDINDHLESDIQLQRFTRAYILRLIGGILFPDHSGRFVHLRFLELLEDLDEARTYSWGSAVLSYLYRELCKATDYNTKDIGGACILVQLWAWDRFPCIAPTPHSHLQQDAPLGARWSGSTKKRGTLANYRYKFDELKRQDILWEPYTPLMMQKLSPEIQHGQELWRAVVPMICYHIVEWHQPDRVMRQFGMEQHIPRPPFQPDYLHDITLRGKNDEDWHAKHLGFISIWEQRHTLVVSNDPQQGLLSSNSEYMKWYNQHTRRWISKEVARLSSQNESLQRIYYYSTDEGHQDGTFTWEALRAEVVYCLEMNNEMHRIIEPAVSAPLPSQEIPEPQIERTIPKRRAEGRGLNRTRRQVAYQPLTVSQPPQPMPGMYYVPPIAPSAPMSSYLQPDTRSSSLTNNAPGSTSQHDSLPGQSLNLNGNFVDAASAAHVASHIGEPENRERPPRATRRRRRACISSHNPPNGNADE